MLLLPCTPVPLRGRTVSVLPDDSHTWQLTNCPSLLFPVILRTLHAFTPFWHLLASERRYCLLTEPAVLHIWLPDELPYPDLSRACQDGGPNSLSLLSSFQSG